MTNTTSIVRARAAARASQKFSSRAIASSALASRALASRALASCALSAALLTCSIAFAQESNAKQTLGRAPRGASGSIEITAPGLALRAKATSDTTAPILVRVTHGEGDTYRVEYLGLVSGRYDLAPYLEQVDGRAASSLGTLEVEVFTQLPPNAGTDVFGLDAPSFGFAAHYRTILATIGAAWIAIPLFVLIRRALKPKAAPAHIIEPKIITTEDLLFAAVDAARARELSVDERGRLELLLLQVLRETGHGDVARSETPADLARAMRSLREDDRSGVVVRAVERWLHASNETERAAALDAIDALRQARAGAAVPREVAP